MNLERRNESWVNGSHCQVRVVAKLEFIVIEVRHTSEEVGNIYTEERQNVRDLIFLFNRGKV